MITPAFCATLALYNRWQNQNLTAAADGLGPQERDRGRGAFFGSIAGTLNHLLWADAVWMARFEDVAGPGGSIAGSAWFRPDWAAFKADRLAMDARIIDWAEALDDAALAGDLRWHSGALGREVATPKALCVMHFFNHQTHHRGQVHAMLTAAGAEPGDTDLFILHQDDAP